jgi:hypothetical protein
MKNTLLLLSLLILISCKKDEAATPVVKHEITASKFFKINPKHKIKRKRFKKPKHHNKYIIF